MIYLLKRQHHVGWDEFESKVVRADSEQLARTLANETVGDEGKIWNDPSEVECVVISPDGPSCVIMEAFNAG